MLPVSNRFSSSGHEFKSRLYTFSNADLEYLVDLIFQGDECITCLKDEYLDILPEMSKENISHKKDEDMKELLGYIRRDRCAPYHGDFGKDQGNGKGR